MNVRQLIQIVLILITLIFVSCTKKSDANIFEGTEFEKTSITMNELLSLAKNDLEFFDTYTSSKGFKVWDTKIARKSELGVFLYFAISDKWIMYNFAEPVVYSNIKKILQCDFVKLDENPEPNLKFDYFYKSADNNYQILLSQTNSKDDYPYTIRVKHLAE